LVILCSKDEQSLEVTVNEKRTHELIITLTEIANQVSQGDYRNAGTLFELTKVDKYPPNIVTLAESFGMMVVKIDAKQQYLERLIEQLNCKREELEWITSQLLSANIGILEVLGSAVAKRDSDTNAHNYRVTIHAIHLGKALGLDNAALCSLIKGSFLHDVGKIGISDSILLKSGKLTDDEFTVMKTHVLHGSEIIKNYEWLNDAADVVMYHHEKFDGSGYPEGISGDKIPLNARIFALSDVFDAMTSKRPYKEPISADTSMEMMAAEAGKHFDPELFKVFREGAVEMYEMLASFNSTALTERLHALMRDYYGTKLIF
jgi:HD-GYP domain-containing protein (c-di-GMP phosphodiesterase class II)